MCLAQQEVWENSDLRQHILRFLRVKHVFPLLMVSKRFFGYAVERIYRELNDVDHEIIMERCLNSWKAEVYRGAVRIFSVKYPILQPPSVSEWTHYFDLFPTLSTITLGRNVLRLASFEGKPRFEYDQSRLLRLENSQLKWDEDESYWWPEDWNRWHEGTLIHLDLCSEYQLSPDVEDDGKIDLSSLLKGYLNKSNYTLHGVTINMLWVSRQLLQCCQNGSIGMNELYSFRLDQTIVDIIHSQVKTLKALRMVRPQYTHQPLGLVDLMVALPWDRLDNLKELHLNCQRFSTGSDELMKTLAQTPKSRYHSLPGCGIRSLRITITYPNQPNLTQEQISKEKDLIRCLAHLIAPLVDGEHWNWKEPWNEQYLKAYYGEANGSPFAIVGRGVLEEAFVEEIESCLLAYYYI